MTNGSVLSTLDGKAEILLAPDALLWIGARSAIRMQDDDVNHPRIEVLSGSAVIWAANGPAVTVICNGSEIQPSLRAQLRIDGSQLSVTEGDAQAKLAHRFLPVRQGDTLNCASGAITRSAAPERDDLDRWVHQRQVAIKAGIARSARLAVNSHGKTGHKRSMPFPAATMQFPGRLR
jgi:hypothetical protein